MSLNLTTVRDAASMNGIKVLVYSEAGAGKTVLCTTVDDPIIISAEAGLLSAAKILKEQNREDIPVITITSFKDMDDAYNFVVHGDGRNYKTICLDSITEIAEQILADAKARNRDPRQAYGELADKCVLWIKRFRDLIGRDVYFSCKMTTKGSEVLGGAKFGPHMPGASLKVDLPYLFDEVFYLGVGVNPETNQSFRYIRTQPDVQYEAKDRSGALDMFEAPHLGYIINKIKASITG